MDIVISKFLREGVLGDLKIGMDADIAQSILGIYEEISQKKDIYIIFKYKDLQLTFNKEHRLILIALYFRNGVAHLPYSLAHRDLYAHVGGFQSLRDNLEKASISVDIDPLLTFEHQSCLSAGPGVRIIHRQPDDEIATIQFGL